MLRMGWPGDRGGVPNHFGGRSRRRGRSGLHRARWWVTPTRGNPRDSATENRPPAGPAQAGRAGKGETAVQETTSGPGDRTGSANPTWSKVKKSGATASGARTYEGCPPECAGRPLEGAGNSTRRQMVANRCPQGPGNRTRPTGQPVRTKTWDLRRRRLGAAGGVLARLSVHSAAEPSPTAGEQPSPSSTSRPRALAGRRGRFLQLRQA